MSLSPVIILLILFVLILIFIYLMTRGSSINDNGIIYDYKRDIRPKLKTGDIMLFSSKKNGSFIKELSYQSRTGFLGTEYGHVGLVLKNPKNDKLLMLECTDYSHTGDELAIHLNNYKRGGIRIIDLDVLIYKYCHEQTGIFAVKFIKEEIPYKLIMDNLYQYREVIFESKIKLITLAVIDLILSHQMADYLVMNPSGFLAKNNSKSKYRRMMCSEFAYEILYRCGALKANQSKLIWPHNYTLKSFKNLEIIKFSKQYKFTIKK